MTLDSEMDSRAPVGGGIGERFQPDMTAAATYLDGLKRQTPPSPESDLALDVLEDAVACLQKYHDSAKEKERRIFLETEAWIDEKRSRMVFFFSQCLRLPRFGPRLSAPGIAPETFDRSAVQCSVA
jgi:hypothetical protein